MSQAETVYVRDDRGLKRLVERLAEATVIGLDTEFLTERSYYPRLCLLQLAADGLLAVVDPFSCSDLAALAEPFGGDVELVVHAGEQDLAILKQRVGTVPERVFDTQIAAAFAGFGHAIGYSRLVEACCQVRLKRSQAYTDWSRRPLDRQQLEYALDDVRYLLPLHDQLRRTLSEKGRLEWAELENAAAQRRALEEIDPRRQWRRLAGTRRFDRRQLGVLQELAAWREDEAARRNQPRHRVVPDRVLVEIARRAPRRVAQLRGMRGLHANEAKRSGEAIVARVRRGLDQAEESLPRRPAKPAGDDDPDVATVATLLDAFLRARAAEEGLSSRLLAKRDDLEQLVRMTRQPSATAGPPPSLDDAEEPAPDAPRDRLDARRATIPLLEGWRNEVAGEDLLRLLRGELRIAVDPESGGLRVEPVGGKDRGADGS